MTKQFPCPSCNAERASLEAPCEHCDWHPGPARVDHLEVEPVGRLRRFVLWQLALHPIIFAAYLVIVTQANSVVSKMHLLNVGSLAYEGLFYCHVSLVAAWTALGATRLRWRLAAFAGVLVAVFVIELGWRVLYGFAFGQTYWDGFVTVALMMRAGIPVVTVLLLTIPRMWRYRLGRRRYSVLDETPSTMQFSIRNIMGVTLATAILLVAGRSLADQTEANMPPIRLAIMRQVTLGAILAAITIVTAVAALTVGDPHLRVLVAICINAAFSFMATIPVRSFAALAGLNTLFPLALATAGLCIYCLMLRGRDVQLIESRVQRRRRD